MNTRNDDKDHIQSSEYYNEMSGNTIDESINSLHSIQMTNSNSNIYRNSYKHLPDDFEENELNQYRRKPPKRNPSEILQRYLSRTSHNTFDKETNKNTQDIYFKTSASSNDGSRSQYQSTVEALSAFSPKESQTAERMDTAISVPSNLQENDSMQSKKDVLLGNIKYLYDQNTNRSKKRTEQMKKLRKAKSSDHSNLYSGQEQLYQDHYQEIFIKPPHITNIITSDSSQNKSKMTLDVEDNNIINDDAEVIVSDLDCSYNETENNILTNSQLQSNKSFVPITNCLKTKSVIKEDNATPSYLLALNQYEENKTSKNEEKDILNTEDYDSLEYQKYDLGLSREKNDDRAASCKSVKHVRLPSGKNYLINSIIEEEFNETYTDSEISIKKQRSYLFSKSKNESSEKKISLRASRDIFIEKNSENAFFNKIKTISVDGDSFNSKEVSEFTKVFGSNYKKKTCHKIAKSEIFNLQIDLKKTLDELSKKKNEEDEQVKHKVENKKKELIDLFYNKCSDSSLNSLFTNTNQKFVLQINIEKQDITMKNKNSLGHTREEYYKNIHSNEKEDNLDISKISAREEFEMKFSSPIKKDNSEDVINYNDQNSIKKISMNYNSIREKYKKERKKSSIFKSEDLRVSKIDSNNLHISPKYQNFSNLSKIIKDKRNSVTNSIIDHNSSNSNNINNININSPKSIISIKNEINEFTLENKVTDKTFINPLDKHNSNYYNFSDCNNCITPICLSISKNKFNNDSIKRKLFTDGLEEKKNHAIKNMVIANEINLDIIKTATELELKEPEPRRFERNRRISMEVIKNPPNSSNTNKLGIPISSTKKHVKMASMNINTFNEYKKNVANALYNFNTADIVKKSNKDELIMYKKNLFLNEPRSYSNNSMKNNTETYLNTRSNRNDSLNKKLSPIKKVSVSELKNKKERTPTPSTTKIKIASETDTKNNKERNNKVSIPIPKQPNKKIATYRAQAEIPISNITKGKFSNKLKIFEAMRFLNYPKFNNLDLHKLALEKLAKSKSSNFVLLIEETRKGYVNYFILTINRTLKLFMK